MEKGVTVSMEDYTASIEKIEDIRKVKGDEELTKIEMKVYQKFVGKLAWLAANTRPDLSVMALLMSKKNAGACIRDLKKINHVIEKIQEKPNKVEYTRIGDKEDLMLHGLTDASYKPEDRSISGHDVRK
jgi:hypothetical protein